MADFCKQCSEEIFKEDFGDLAGISTIEEEVKGRYPIVICEGCGIIQVDHHGHCLSHCLKSHHQ